MAPRHSLHVHLFVFITSTSSISKKLWPFFDSDQPNAMSRAKHKVVLVSQTSDITIRITSVGFTVLQDSQQYCYVQLWLLLFQSIASKLFIASYRNTYCYTSVVTTTSVSVRLSDKTMQKIMLILWFFTQEQHRLSVCLSSSSSLH